MQGSASAVSFQDNEFLLSAATSRQTHSIVWDMLFHSSRELPLGHQGREKLSLSLAISPTVAMWFGLSDSQSASQCTVWEENPDRYELLCSSVTEECYFQDCATCRDPCLSPFLQSHLTGDGDKQTKWTCWKRTDNRVALQPKTGSVSLLLDDIDEQRGNSLPHHYCMKR